MLHTALHQKHFLVRNPGALFPFRRMPPSTLLPFFNQEGKICHGLLFQYKTASVFFVRELHMMQQLPLLNVRCFESQQLVPIAQVPKILWEQLYTLYHFDPWWLLRRPEFGHVPGLPQLKATNIAHHSKLCLLEYDRTMLRVNRLIDSSMQTLAWERVITYDTRKPIERVRKNSRIHSPQWVLEPFWQ